LAGIVLASLDGNLLFVLFAQGEHLVRLAGYDVVTIGFIHSLSDGLPRGQVVVNGAEEPVSKLNELAAGVALGPDLAILLLGTAICHILALLLRRVATGVRMVQVSFSRLL